MAAPEQFFDPFFSHTLDGGFSDGKDDLELPVTGQGTIAIKTNAKNLLSIQVYTNTVGAPTLNLELGPKEWRLFYQGVGGTVDMKAFVQRKKSEQDCWLRQAQDPTVYCYPLTRTMDALDMESGSPILRWFSWS
jgi:hypothetical protein